MWSEGSNDQQGATGIQENMENAPRLVTTVSGNSISGSSLSIKIVQSPHHWAYGIEHIIESHNILDLVSSICCWLDFSGYDGSSVGCQWDYTIAWLPDQFQFLDVWDHFQLATPPCNKFLVEEFFTISCKAKTSTCLPLFMPILVEMDPSSEGIHSKSESLFH